jgi:hypothetical protein
MPGYHNAQGGCYIYGSNQEGIDTGVIIEGEGVLFLSATALLEMAEVMGWDVRTDWEAEKRALQEALAYAEHERDQAQTEAKELRADLEAFGRALATHTALGKP